MKSVETRSCSLCNKLYTYLYHHIVVLNKYIHSNLVYGIYGILFHIFKYWTTLSIDSWSYAL